MIFRRRERELDQELRHHLETLADSYQSQGYPRDEALRRARADFGPVESLKDACRDERRFAWLEAIAQDLRFGWRMLWQAPAFTLAAVVTLALGIGATSTILSFADVILWRDLPVTRPEELKELFWATSQRAEGLYRSASGSGFQDGPLRVQDYFSRDAWQAMRERTREMAEVAAHAYPRSASLSTGQRVAVVQTRAVSGNFFAVLGARPAQGRLLMEGDDRAEAPPALMLTHRQWEQVFPGEPWHAARTVRLNNVIHVVAGVLRPDFGGLTPGDDVGVYVPLLHAPEMREPESWLAREHTSRQTWWLQLLVRQKRPAPDGRLRPLLQDAMLASLERPPKSAEQTPRLMLSEARNGLGGMRRRFADPVRVLGVLVVLVLLMACANIANLLLARGAGREREAAMRVALGCSGGRLMRQFFTESLLLAASGGTLSVAVAVALGRVLASLMPQGVDGDALAWTLDPRTLAGTAAVTLLTALIFGLWPARRAASIEVSAAAREGAGSAGTATRSRWRAARSLVMLQVGLGVLLVGAALVYGQQLRQIVDRDAGFERSHALLFDLRPGETGHSADKLPRFYAALVRSLEALPGVQAVGLSQVRPMRGGGYWDDAATVNGEKRASVGIHHATPGFLPALGVALQQGRWVTEDEVARQAGVAVISENLAKDLELTAPLGARIRLDNRVFDVIGVARQARYAVLTDSPSVVYLPFDPSSRAATVTIRTSLPPMAVLAGVRQAVRELDRDLPLVDVLTLEQQISLTLQRERLFAWLCGTFGLLALVLCAVGLYGLLSYMTARRTAEIGIRLALGASRGRVLAHVFGEGMRLVLAGFAMGLPLAWQAARWAVEKKLWPETFGVAGTMAAAVAVLVAVAALAAFAPAWRASLLDPMGALRRG